MTAHRGSGRPGNAVRPPTAVPVSQADTGSLTLDALPKNVRRARRFAGLTLEQLAGQIGKSKGWLSLVENGKVRLEKAFREV